MKQVIRVDKSALDNEQLSLIVQRDLAYKRKSDAEKTILECTEVILRADGALMLMEALSKNVVLEAEEGDITPQTEAEGEVNGTISS